MRICFWDFAFPTYTIKHIVSQQPETKYKHLKARIASRMGRIHPHNKHYMFHIFLIRCEVNSFSSSSYHSYIQALGNVCLSCVTSKIYFMSSHMHFLLVRRKKPFGRWKFFLFNLLLSFSLEYKLYFLLHCKEYLIAKRYKIEVYSMFK